ncbi:MAG: hypothetical protein K0S93_28 [Nitrososphaeraceae archaeon]|nr:hypothetical protein [Nitrososphaeraceae archaeon]
MNQLENKIKEMIKELREEQKELGYEDEKQGGKLVYSGYEHFEYMIEYLEELLK